MNIAVGIKTLLDGDGDFRSKECLEVLDECDIVATNPPFSLFREYVTVLMEHKKKTICNDLQFVASWIYLYTMNWKKQW